MMIRRKKTTIFTDAKDTTPVHELKKMIEGDINMFISHNLFSLFSLSRHLHEFLFNLP